jgi:iron(III) transport system substrate-binding protein
MVSPQIRRCTATALAVAMSAVLATGCARDGAGASSNGKDTGKVTVACGATEQWCAAMTEQFTKATGVKASFVRLSSGEALARMQAGKGKPEFDVWHGGPADGYAAAIEQSLLQSYSSPAAASIPDRYKDRDGYWTGVYVGALGFCSNTKVLAEKKVAAPQSWQDLLNPALKSNIGIAHPSTSGTAYTALWTHVVVGGSQDAGLAYARRLHPNVLQYSKSGAAPGQQAARGEVAVGVIFGHDCIAAKEEGFKDLTLTFPSEGTGYEVGGVALLANAPNGVGGRKYVDWSLTTAAQEIGPTVKSYQTPTNPQAKVSGKTPDINGIKLIDYNVAAAGAAKKDLTKKFDTDVAQAPK